MSTLHPRPYRVGDPVATVAVRAGGSGLERHWRLGVVAGVFEPVGIVVVRWDDNAVGNFTAGDANLRHVDDIPVDERTWLSVDERNRAIRREAASRLEAVVGAWVHSDAHSRAVLSALITDLGDLNSIDCMGCDLAARRLLGVDPVADDDLARGGAA